MGDFAGPGSPNHEISRLCAGRFHPVAAGAPPRRGRDLQDSRAQTCSKVLKKNPISAAPGRVFIVDDHPMMVLGLERFLTQDGDLMVCGESPHAKGALAGIERTQPDLVLLDVSLQGRSGLDLLEDLRLRFPNLPVLVHSMHDEMIY